MHEQILLGLASIIVFGIGAQWLAWRLRAPSILLLLLDGILVGPVVGFLHPDELLGELLIPLVSLSVAVILFEGGLSLRFSELPKVGGVVRDLISLGALVTWVISTLGAHFLLQLSWPLAVLFGSILVVTGPTVIIPLLRQVRPSGDVGAILKWEGILIDPIGAILALLVFEVLVAGGPEAAAGVATVGVLRALLVGGLSGLVGAGLIILLFKRYWVPDYLQNPVTLMIVVLVFAVSNVLRAESGLLAVTIMGFVLANQKLVVVKHIIEFKENLRVLLIASLFVLLAARLQPSDLQYLGIGSIVFLLVLIFVARPLAVLISTMRSELHWREKAYLAALAPRGIVAAAVASVFALRLSEARYEGAERLVPLTFLVIIGTVTIYGLLASPVAHWLKIAKPHPQGVLIVGAHDWARRIAAMLQARAIEVLLVDTNWTNVSAARMAGLRAVYANILSDYIQDDIDLGGIGHLLALTPNDEVNTLAAQHFAQLFGRSEVFQLPPKGQRLSRQQSAAEHLGGRLAFGPGLSFSTLDKLFREGAEIKSTSLTREFGVADFLSRHGQNAMPLFIVSKSGTLAVFTEDMTPSPQPGQTLIYLVPNTDITPRGQAGEEPAEEA